MQLCSYEPSFVLFPSAASFPHSMQEVPVTNQVCNIIIILIRTIIIIKVYFKATTEESEGPYSKYKSIHDTGIDQIQMHTIINTEANVCLTYNEHKHRDTK